MFDGGLAALVVVSALNFYVVDNTGVLPVGSAVKEWDNGTIVNLSVENVCPSMGGTCIILSWDPDNICYAANPNATPNSLGGCTDSLSKPCNILVEKAAPKSERNLIVAHEIGHCLQLEHNEDKDSLMYYMPTRSTPSQKDKEKVNAYYERVSTIRWLND